MKTRRIFTAIFLTICMLAGNVSPAFAMPPLPSSFYGTVLVNGVNPPTSTIVSAWINGVKYSDAVVSVYQTSITYSLNVGGDDPETEGTIEGGVTNDTIVFKIGELVATQTGVWRSGTNVMKNLTATQNFPPVITEGDSIGRTMSEDGAPTAFDLTLNATDVNNDIITWSISTPAGNGSASASGTGTSKVIGYTPNANYHGLDSFVVQASDSTGSDTITVNVIIQPVNDIPVADSQSGSTLENVAKNITLSASDIDGDSLTYILGAPAHGTLSGTAPDVTYTPTLNYSGSDSFTFKVNDGTADSNTATVSLTVTMVNAAPVCSAVSLTTNEDTTGSIAPTCNDGDGDTLTYETVVIPSHGAASVVSNTLQYVPIANYNGSDTFTYKAFDGLVYSNIATVNVTVNPINDAPVANAQSLATNEDTALSITLTGSDIEGSLLTFEITVDPQHGTLTGSGASRTYTPSANYTGSDSFTIRANDGSLNSTPAVISISVNPVNDAPVAVADSYSTPEDTALTVAAPGVLSNDTDVDLDTLTAIKVSNPTSGSVTLNANGSFTYTPNVFFNGIDSFTYKVNDSHVDGNTVTVTINVSSVNNAPVCSLASLNTAEDTNGQATPSCTDPDGPSISYNIVDQPSNGTASIVAGKLSYTPVLNYFGSDSFTYKAYDGLLYSNTATVTVTVTAVNDLPTISDITDKSTNEDTSTGAIPFTVGDVETAAGSLTVTATSSNTTLVPNSNITLGGSGASRTLSIAPTLNQSGTTTITVTVSDGNSPISDTFVLTVNAVNDLPTISNITDKSTNEDTAISNISFTVGDVETSAASLIVTATSSNTVLVPNENITLGGSGANRTIGIAPASNQFGTTTITVNVNDGTSSTSDTFVLTVNAVNDLPTISNITDKSTNEDTATGDITFTISDVETAAGSLSVTATSSNTSLVPNGNITLGGSGANRVINITPALNLSGTSTITVTINDGDAGAVSDTFVLTVLAMNDLPTISDLIDKSTNEDTATGNIAFTVDDLESSAASLIVTAISSSTTLVPNGNIVLGGSGANRTINITPAANQFGATTITVTVNDGTVSANDTFVLTVIAVNDAPVSVSDTYATPEDTTLTISAPGVLSNDTDVDGDLLTAIKVTDPIHGTLTLNANGSFTYVPGVLYHGTDSFTYKSNDATVDSNIVTVTINVSSVNNQPVAVDDTFAAIEDTAKILPATGAGSPAANDTDLDLDTLTVTAVSSPVGGTVNLSGGLITFTSTSNLCGIGAGKFNYTVADGNGGTDLGLVTLDIACVNDVPTISDITNKSTNEDISTGSIAFTVGDVETPATLTVTAISSNTTLVPNGNITLGGSGANRTISILPASDQTGTTTITVTVNDGTDTVSDTFILTVNAVNDLPTITDIADKSTNEDTSTGNINFMVGDAETPAASLTVTATSSNTTLVPNGNITLGGSDASRTISILPASNQSGATIITVTVTDANSGSSSDTFVLTVVAVNDLPTISDITDKSTNEDTPTSGIAFTVSDVETPVSSLIVTGTSSNTALVPNANIVFGGTGANRTIVITPAANQSGTSTITIMVNDGLDTISDTFVLTVIAMNDLPTISDITNKTTNEDTPTSSIAFTVGDIETSLASLIVTGTSSNTTLVPNANIVLGGTDANRTLVITPAANQNGTTTITVTVNDGTATASDTFVLTVTALNDAPIITGQTALSTPEDTALTITLTNLTVTDVDNTYPTGFTLTVQAGTNYTLVGNTITPAANFNGVLTVPVKVNDGLTDSNIFNLSVTVTAVNDLPTISNITDKSTNEDTSTGAIPFTVGDVETLAADLTVTATSSNTTLVPNGNITVGGSGANRTVNIAPAPNQFGTSTITITVNDGANSVSDTFILTVNAVNDLPTISDITDKSTNEDTSTSSIAFTIGDVETPTASLTVTGTSSNSTLIPNANIIFGGTGANRTLVITPAANKNGTSTITVAVSDGSGSANDIFVLTVTAVNDTPAAVNDSKSTLQNTPITIDVLANDSDVDGDSLTISAFDATSVHGGAVTCTTTCLYTPTASYVGSDSFTYTISDGHGGTAIATVTIDVGNVNEAPVAVADGYSTNEDTALTVATPGILSNDSDPDGDSLTAVKLTDPTNGTLTLNANGSFTYTPNANYFGTDSFTYKTSDGTLSSNTVTVTITVNAVNDLPTISDITNKSTNEDTATGSIAFTVGDVETPAASLTVTAISSNTTLVPNANISLGGSDADRTISITPAANQNGTTTITVTVTDANTGSTSDTFVLTVVAVNDAPVITGQAALSTPEETALTIILSNLTVTDIDTVYPTGFTLTVQAGTNYTFVGNTITPAANFNGTLTVPVKVNDGSADSNIFNVSVVVTAVNDLPTISNVIDRSTDEDTSTGNINFTVSDVETPTASLTVTATSSNTTLVPNGNITLGGSGSDRTISIMPASNQSGTSTITITVSDANSGLVSDMFVLTVIAVNDLPTVSDISDKSTNEDISTGSIAFAVGDVETPAASLTVTATSSNTTLVPNANIILGGSGTNRTLVITPAANQNGTTTITVTVNDGTATASDTFVLIVTALNDAPMITGQTALSTPEDTALTIALANLTVTDVDNTYPTGFTLTVQAGTNYTLVGNTITPAANFNGVLTVPVKVNDGLTDSNIFNLSVTVTAVNDLPTISNITDKSTNEDTSTGSIAFTVGDVETLAADLTVTATSSNTTLVPNGNITVGGSGANRTVNMTPAANQNGTTTITVTVNDANSGSSSDTFVLTVNAVNDAPVAIGDTYSTAEDTTLNVAAPGVLTNDSDVEGTALNAVKATEPSHGTLTLNTNGSFTYVPAANYNGPDSFTYKANDGSLDSNIVTVTINVSSVNNAPIAVDDTFTATEDTAKTFPVSGAGSPASNDTDVDGDTLTVTSVSSPIGGTVSLIGSTITFMPTANLCGAGAGSFQYVVSDGHGGVDNGFVTLNISCINDVPVANAQSVTTNEDTAKPIVLTGSDVESSITFAVVSGPAHGMLSGTVPNLTYTPAANYNGPDSFTFKVNDGTIDSLNATVSITVTPVNDAPVANAQSVNATEDTPLPITLMGSDMEISAITYAVTVNPLHGTLSGTGANRTYTPDTNYNGSDTFTFKVNDGTLDSATAVVTITVTPVNDAPVANNQSVTTNEDTAKSITLTGSDVENATLTFLVVSQPAHGTLTGTPPTVTYIPAAHYFGSDSFTFKVNDGTTDSTTATVSITVVPNEYTLTVTTVGSGSITRNPAKATYHYGDEVQLTAVSDAGWQFSSWSGDLTGSTNPQSITITGNKSITATFIGTAMPKPGIPLLLSPANCTATLDTTPWFDWSDPNPAASYYRIQIAENAFFVMSEVDQTNITTSEYTPIIELMPGHVYFWRVQAFNSTGEASNWSSIKYFRLIPQAPVLVDPLNATRVSSLRPDFDWNDVSGASYYTIQVSKNNSFTKLVMMDVSLSSSLSTRKDLPSATTLYWRVRANSFAGDSAWSETWSFTTPNPPGVPTLVSPRYDSTTSDTQPLFKWNKVNVPSGTYFDHYQIQIDTDPSFELPVFDVDIVGLTNTNYMPMVPLSANTKYFWRVRAVNTDGDISSWSSTWMFHTPRSKGPRWHTGIFSGSGEYVSWESGYSLDETLIAPILNSSTGRFLNWGDVSNGTGYIVQVSTESTFSSAPLLASATTVDSDYALIKNLTPGTTIYWRVLTISGEYISNWSSVSSFQVP